MTTSKPTEAREFWIDIEINKPKVQVTNVWKTNCLESIHVIEYRAVEQLKAELAYYKNGTQIKEIHYDEPVHIIAENNKLHEQVKDYEQAQKEISFLKQIIQRQNTELETFHGMTFSENQEILELREQIAEHEQYKTDTFEAYSALDDVNIKLGEKVKDYEQALELIADRNAHGVMVTIAREVLKKWCLK